MSGIRPGVPMAVPDPNLSRMQMEAMEAQKEWAELQLSHNVRAQKANHAITFLSIATQTDTEGARAEAAKWLSRYFEHDTRIESALPREHAVGAEFATA